MIAFFFLQKWIWLSGFFLHKGDFFHKMAVCLFLESSSVLLRSSWWGIIHPLFNIHEYIKYIELHNIHEYIKYIELHNVSVSNIVGETHAKISIG